MTATVKTPRSGLKKKSLTQLLSHHTKRVPIVRRRLGPPRCAHCNRKAIRSLLNRKPVMWRYECPRHGWIGDLVLETRKGMR